jgi:hypothetical protein
MNIVNNTRATSRPESLFAGLPGRQNVGIIPRRSALGRAVHSQVKVPAGVVAAVVAVVSVVVAALANRH